ncbi:MAG: CRISPR-associated endonuclease Cas1 [Ilumatobacteraceae bacterium]
MRYLNTLYVSGHDATVGHRKGSIVVTRTGRSNRVPLEAIDSVVLLGNSQVTTSAIDACVRHEVRVCALRRNGAVRFVVGGPRGGNVHLRTAQHRVADGAGSVDYARSFLAAKLQNSRRMLLRWSRDAPVATRANLALRAEAIGNRLVRLANANDPGTLLGIEGDAARIYFAGMGQVLDGSGFSFELRSRRPPRDPVNAMLGFGYGLLVTEMVGAAESVGLDHQIGFLHRARSGRPSLALDMAEELRPLVDRFVVRVLRRRQIGTDSFRRMPGGGTYLSDFGRAAFLELWEVDKNREVPHTVLDRAVERWALPSIQATLLARSLRGDLRAYPGYVMQR